MSAGEKEAESSGDNKYKNYLPEAGSVGPQTQISSVKFETV